jgi:hypothetical protein
MSIMPPADCKSYLIAETILYIVPVCFLSWPKSVIGYPEAVEKTGFPINKLRE